MMTSNTLQTREFVQRIFIDDIERLIKSELYHFAFVIMSQGLETLGSFLDSKPLKAREQSKLRFSHAINRLMPREYGKLNNNHKLYNQLRASMAHTFTSSREIYLTSKNHKIYGNKHLNIIEGKLILVAELFFSDFKKACIRLFDGIDKGIVSEKKANEKFYYTF
ncbi:MAG: hypothetical protein MI739_09455 [Bacteroidales bacterium]|nr:hypothetical protein [Bacteroidales bacterium]